MKSKILLLFALLSSLTVLNAQNNSLLFDGINDKVQMLNEPIYNLNNGFTLEAWIYAEAWKPSVWQGSIIAKDQDPQKGFVLRCGANGTLSWTVGTGANWNEITSGPVMSTTTWYHVAAVLDGGQSRIYINGSLAGSGACPASASSTSQLLIGESSGFAGRVFDGRIDEVRIWNIVRSEAEIAANMAIDIAPSSSGLVAYYKLDETTGTIAQNAVDPSVTDGTLINFGNSPWQSGYAIPGLDMKCEAILSPDALTLNGGAAQVKARFLNNGLDQVSTFQVSYVFNGANPVTETVDLTLAPGESYVHSFSELVLSNPSGDDLTVTVSLIDDSNILNDNLSVSYEPLAGPSTLNIFEDVQHNFSAAGQSHLSTVVLPENNSAYGTILMDIWVDCPGSGCDPWDQPAKISLVKDGVTYELARFITPYGKACGPWVIDVTDFKSLLQGDCDFNSYIQVWGSSGWLLNASLTFLPGAADHPFQRVTPLYDTDNWVYGDPAINDDLPTQTAEVHSMSLDARMRMTISGHGQANTNNAAEFSPKTHQFVVNGADFQSHYLWKNDCEFNDCSNQFGTWTYDRAGWCPGQGVYPLELELGSVIIPGESISLDYELQAYTNLLNTGYNGGSHTEPHYKIHSYLIEKGDQHIASETWTNATALELTAPSSLADLSAASPVIVEFKNTGLSPISHLDMKAYSNGALMLDEDLDFIVALMPGEIFSYMFTGTLDLSDASADMNVSILVFASGDEAANDNTLHRHFDLVDALEELKPLELLIYPNPNQGQVMLFVSEMQSTAVLTLHDLAGREVMRYQSNPGALAAGLTIKLPYASGTYLLSLESAEGRAMRRLVLE